METTLLSAPNGDIRGSGLVMRELNVADRPEIIALFERLSDQDRYYRFFRPMPTYSDALLNTLTGMDGRDHVAVGAFCDGRLAGVARFIRLNCSPTTAELAVSVCPNHRGQGIARVLLDWLEDRAAQACVQDFEVYVHPQNRTAARVFGSRGFKMRFEDGASYGKRPVRGQAPLAAA